MANKIKNTLAT